MKKIIKTFITLSTLFFATSSFSQIPQFNVLLFTKTAGYHHQSINEGVDAIRDLGQRNMFTVDWQESAFVFNEESLKQYDVIIFLNTTGDVLNREQELAMENFIKSGKGFVGVHAAADTEYDWEWYTQLVGHMFRAHPPIATAKISVVDGNFPGMETTPKIRWWTDEWYEFSAATVDDLNYLITVDESSYDFDTAYAGQPLGMGELHPVAWYHEYDGGRSFYTNLGHMPEKYEDTIFLENLLGGIMWSATGKGL